MPEPTIWTGSLSVPDLGQRLITYCLDIPPPQATASCFDEVKGSGCIVSQVLEKTPKSLIPLGLTGWVRRRGGGFLTGSHVYRQIGWKVYQETSALEISVKKKKKKKANPVRQLNNIQREKRKYADLDKENGGVRSSGQQHRQSEDE